jgi:hypothetical protein
MQCKQCNNANPDGAKFCQKCGAKMEHPCSSCGKINAVSAKFCEHCGASTSSNLATQSRQNDVEAPLVETEQAQESPLAPMVAEIITALQQVRSMGESACVTLEVVGDSDRWAQFMDGTINLAYPANTPPKSNIPLFSLSTNVRFDMSEFEPGVSLTGTLSSNDLKITASWLYSYFLDVLGCTEGNFELAISMEDLG